MNSLVESYIEFWDVNRAALARYLTAVIVVAAVVIGYFLVQENYRYLTFILAPLVFVMAVTFPRIAVYQFIIMLFSFGKIVEDPVLLQVDISAIILASAALLDFLLRGTGAGRFPKMTVNFLLLLFALLVCAVAGYDFSLVARPMARVLVMTICFLSLYRLSRYFNIRQMVILFFWVGVISAIIAIKPVLAGDQVERVFGLGLKAQDDLMTITLPIGLLLYLWSPKYRGMVYLLGAGVVIVSLLASQTRFPIIFSAGISFVALVVSLIVASKRSGRVDRLADGGTVSPRLVKWRVMVASAVCLIPVVAAALLKPGLISAVVNRFQVLISEGVTGTAELRLVLWTTALQAFRDHPLLGIGPGNFDVIHSIYKQFHLNPAEIYIRGASAHNLFLQYLAEMGLLGGSVLMALLVNQFRLSFRFMRSQVLAARPEIPVILLVLATLFLGTTLIEASWMWAQTSYVFVFFLALIARSQEPVGDDV